MLNGFALDAGDASPRDRGRLVGHRPLPTSGERRRAMGARARLRRDGRGTRRRRRVGEIRGAADGLARTTSWEVARGSTSCTSTSRAARPISSSPAGRARRARRLPRHRYALARDRGTPVRGSARRKLAPRGRAAGDPRPRARGPTTTVDGVQGWRNLSLTPSRSTAGDAGAPRAAPWFVAIITADAGQRGCAGAQRGRGSASLPGPPGSRPRRPRGQEWEVILVEDSSTDGTWELIRGTAAQDARIHGLRLSRSFGHQGALTAGMWAAEGDVVITMDGDLPASPGDDSRAARQERSRGTTSSSRCAAPTTARAASPSSGRTPFYWTLNRLDAARPAATAWRISAACHAEWSTRSGRCPSATASSGG